MQLSRPEQPVDLLHFFNTLVAISFHLFNSLKQPLKTSFISLEKGAGSYSPPHHLPLTKKYTKKSKAVSTDGNFVLEK